MILKANGFKKQASVDNLIFNKLDSKQKLLRRDMEGHYNPSEEKIQQKLILILFISIPNIRAPKYVKESLLMVKIITYQHLYTDRGIFHYSLS